MWLVLVVLSPLQQYTQNTNPHDLHTHTHTRLTALCPGLPRWAGTRKVKPIWILLEQETVSGSGISWAICKSAPCSRQITMPALYYSSFLQAGCPPCRPTNSVKALKPIHMTYYKKISDWRNIILLPYQHAAKNIYITYYSCNVQTFFQTGVQLI